MNKIQKARTARTAVAGGILLFLATSQPAYAYIDPGITSLLAQGLFGIVFGSMAAWVLAPWNYLKRLFGFQSRQAADDHDLEKKDTDVSA